MAVDSLFSPKAQSDHLKSAKYRKFNETFFWYSVDNKCWRSFVLEP